MAKFNVLVTESYTQSALSFLQSQLDCQIERIEIKDLKNKIAGAEALLIRSRTPLDKELLSAASRLKVVITATSGFDHIDYEFCRSRGIAVGFTPEANAQSTAELTLSFMLQLLRAMPSAVKQVEKGHWRDDLSRGHELSGHLLGIVGLGRVGSRLAKLAKAFGMKVIGCDPYKEPAQFTELGIERLSFSEILLAADILSLHVPLTRETYRMINYQTLRHMNSEAYLINASRGQVVDETEVIVALEEGLLKGVAMDVFESEPLAKSSRLRNRPNVILTPHIGAYTEEAFKAASSQAVDNLIHFFAKGQLLTPLPENELWFSSYLRAQE